MNGMLDNLLALGLKGTIVLIVVCVLAAALLIYGFIRRFSRMSWAGIQIAILFFVTRLIWVIPVTQNKYLYFAIIAGGFFGCAAVVLSIGGLVKAFFRSRKKKANWFFRILDRVFGAVNAVLNVGVSVLAVGGFVLAILYYCTGLDEGALSFLYNASFMGYGLWATFGKYAVDLALAAFLTVCIKGGYKLGLLRSVWTGIMMFLTVGALVGAVLVALKAPVISGWSVSLAGYFAGSMNGTLANILGYGIVALGAFVVFVVAIVLLNLVVNLGVREMDKIKVIRFLDGGLFALIIFAVGCALVCGINFAVYQAVGGGFGQMVQSLVQGRGLTELLTSSAYSRALYEFNPILVLLGKI